MPVKNSQASASLANQKGMWDKVTDIPWFVPVLLCLITTFGVVFSKILAYLSRMEELQVKEHENILAYRVKIAEIKSGKVRKAPANEGASNG
jgi:hypothetical protein